MQILLVEDDNTLFQELKRIRTMGFQCCRVEDFGNVMDTFEKFNPEIVILDVQLPKYDGFYWCRKMRQESNVPILFLSSRDNPMDQVMSMELGADDYMQKPFTRMYLSQSYKQFIDVYMNLCRRKRTLNWQDTVVDLSKDSIQKVIKPSFYRKRK